MFQFRVQGRLDWPLVLLVIALTALGLAAIYSVDLSRGDSLDFFPTQVVALGLGLIAIIIGAFLHTRWYQSIARFGYVGVLGLLVGVLFFGETIRGTKGWFDVGLMSFQPAELAKIGLVLMLAWVIDRHGRQFDKWQFVIGTGLIMCLYAFLILLQPDLGSSIILASIWFGLLLMTRTKWRYIFGIIGAGVLVLAIGWFFLFAPYQKERIQTFVSPERDPLGAGYNVTQSIIAIGSGKLVGRGLGFGSQSQLHFLPEAHTDFIFAVIAEELGFVGAILLFVVYFLLLWRLLFLARQCGDDFSAYVVLGASALFFFQMVINIGGATGFLPVTGVPFPFVSYGGSSLLVNCTLIGIVLGVVRSQTTQGDLLDT
jgi:rod shape determining protein RodA